MFGRFIGHNIRGSISILLVAKTNRTTSFDVVVVNQIWTDVGRL